MLGLVHWDDPEGWDGEGGGRGVQDGEHTHTHMHTMLACIKSKIKSHGIFEQFL